MFLSNVIKAIFQPAIILSIDNYRIVDANKGFFEMIEVNESSIIGKCFFEFINIYDLKVFKNHLELFEAAFESPILTNQPFEIHNLLLENGRDSDFDSVDIFIIPNFNDKGAVDCLLVTINPIKNTHVRVNDNLKRNTENLALVNSISCNDLDNEKALQQLNEMNTRYEYVIKATSEVIWDWDIVHNTVYWSPYFETIFGYDILKFEKGVEVFYKLIHPEDFPRLQKDIDQLLAGTCNYWQDEYRLIRADGNCSIVLDKAYIIRNEQGKAIRMVGAIQDITLKKKEEERLKLLESFITHTNDSVMIIKAKAGEYSDDSIIEYVNEAFNALTLYSSNEIIGKTPQLFFGLNTDIVELDKIAESLSRFKTCELTTVFYKKNGDEFWANLSISPVVNEDGGCTHWISIIRDVTEQKKYTLTIEDQKEFLEGLIENVPVALAVYNINKEYVFVNSKAIKDETVREWIIGKNDFDYYSMKGMDDSMAIVRHSYFKKAFENREIVTFVEEYMDKNFEKTYFLRKISPVFQNDELKYYIGYGIEVTESQKTLIALEESEKKYSDLFFHNVQPMIILDIENLKFIQVNKAATELYGYTETEFLNLSFFDIRPESEIEKAKRRIESLKQNIDEKFVGNFLHKKKSNEIIDVEIYASSITIKGKKYRSLLILDITARKKEEDRLRLLESVITNAKDAVLITDAESLNAPFGPKIIYVNPAFTNMTGYDAEDVLGRTPRLLQGPESDMEGLQKMGEGFRKWDSGEMTTINYKKNGEPFWVNFSVTPVANKEGWYTHWISIQRDVTEQINSLEELEEQKQFSEGLLKNIPADIAVFNASHEYIYVNPIALRDESLRKWIIGKTDFDYYEMKGIDNANADVRREKFNKAVQERASVDWVDTVIDKNGELKYVLRRFTPIFQNDALKYVIGYGIDVTENQKMKLELEASAKTYFDLFHLSVQPMVVLDIDNLTFIQVNKAATELYGYSNAEFQELSYIDLLAPLEVENAMKRLEDKRKNIDKHFRGILQHQKKTNETFEVELYSSSILINGKKYRSILIIDASEQKKKEEQLMHAIISAQEKERNEIGAELHDNICQILAGGLMNLSVLKKSIPEEKIAKFEECQSSILLAFNEARNLSHRLAPSYFEYFSIHESFDQLLHTFTLEEPLKFHVDIPDPGISKYITKEVHLNLYRILQEQLSNILKYANATEVRIYVDIEMGKVILKVSDNGVGMDTSTLRKGIGFANIKRRAEYLQGTFELISAIGHGCTILIKIPL